MHNPGPGVLAGLLGRRWELLLLLAKRPAGRSRLLLLLIAPLSWKLGAVGCLLLLLLRSDHPSPLLLLGSPVLSVGHNPEALWLS